MLVDDVEPADAVLLACDLLAAGVDDAAVVALAIESTRSLPEHQADRLLRDMLTTLGVPEPGQATAARLATVGTCERLAAGTLAVERGAHRLLGTLTQEPDDAAVTRLLTLLDRLECDLRGQADPALRAEILHFAREVRARRPM